MPRTASAHRPTQAHAPVSAPANAQAWAQMRLREMMLSGELPAGARITEVSVVHKLGVSRTPIRGALVRLEQEGMLQALPHGGYAVKTFSERDIADAIELRGTLEGLLARLVAERGVDDAALAEAEAVLQDIDALLEPATLAPQAFGDYVRLNEAFHRQLARLADSPVLQQQLERVQSLPFASPSAFVLANGQTPRARDTLLLAQDQHRQVLQAIRLREGARAEALMREHSRLARRNLSQALAKPDAPTPDPALPAIHLIRRSVQT